MTAPHTGEIASWTQREFGGADQVAASERDLKFRVISQLGSGYGYAFRIEANGAVVWEWMTGSFTRITGYTAAEMVARGGAVSLLYPSDMVVALERVRKLLSGESDESEYRVVTKAGTVCWLHDHAQPVWDDKQGRVVRVYGAVQDITARKQAEEALRHSENRFRALIEKSSDGIALLTRQGRVFYATAAICRMLGRRPGSMLERSSLDGMHPEDVSGARQAFAALLRAGAGSVVAECRYQHANGTWVWTESTLTNLLDDASVQAIVCNVRDVTDRKRAETALAAALQERENIMDTIPDVLYTLDQDGRLLKWNRRLEEVSGRSPTDIKGRPLVDFFAEEDRPKIREAITAAMTSGYAEVEAWMCRANGTLIPYQYTGGPLRDHRGRTLGVSGVGRDISERTRAEQHSAVLLELAHTIAGTLDLTELLTRAQRRTAEALPCDGVAVFRRDEHDGQARLIAHHGLAPEAAAAADNVVFSSTQPFGGRLLQGETFVVNDMNAQHWLPAELCARFHLRAMIAAPLHVHGRGLGAIVAFNTSPGRPFAPSQTALLKGIARQLAVALEAAELHQRQREEAEVSAALARVGRETIAVLDTPILLDRLCQLTVELLHCDYSHTWLWRPEDHAYVPVSACGDPPEQWEALRALTLTRALVAPLLPALEAEDVVSLDLSGRAQHPPLATIPARYGYSAGIMVALRRGTDIVGLHTAGYRQRPAVFDRQHHRIMRGIGQLGSLALQSARLLEELARANRLKSEFVATMSHELRTPLNIITGYHSLLLDGAFGTMSADQLDVLRRAEASAQPLCELINATLDMSRLESGRAPVEHSVVDVAELVREVEREVRALCDQKPQVRFAWHIAAPVPPLTTDTLKLKVVLKNLINNALKFTERGHVQLTIQPDAGSVRFSVSDTGIGIDPAVRSIIFEPFRQADSSSTRRYGGVGLGLYIVQRLLELLGGRIALNSQPGHGSTFQVWIPAAATALARRKPARAGKPARRRVALLAETRQLRRG